MIYMLYESEKEREVFLANKQKVKHLHEHSGLSSCVVLQNLI